MISYQEALNRCLEAVREGRVLEDVIAGLPARYAERLREDAALAAEVRRNATAIPNPDPDAQRLAAARLGAELATARAARTAPRRVMSGFGVQRFALAGLVVAAVLAVAAFMLLPSGDGDGTVEASTIEGVVVAGSEDSLTVQTLDRLEQITVPRDARLSDDSGAPLDIASIEAGQVVVVRGSRPPGGPLRAANVERLVNGLPGWCSDAPARCRQIARNLRDAQERCRNNPQACPALKERIEAVIDQVDGIANLEELKQRCREAGQDSCQDFVNLCRLRADLCVVPRPPGPIIERLEEARGRLTALQQLCAQRDTRACREVAAICTSHPPLCGEAAPRVPGPRSAGDPPSPRLAPTPTPPALDQRPQR